MVRITMAMAMAMPLRMKKARGLIKVIIISAIVFNVQYLFFLSGLLYARYLII